MTDQHSRVRAPGIARVLAVLALLAGIVAMHSAVFGTAHAHDTASESHALPATLDTAAVRHAAPAPSDSANITTSGLADGPPNHGLLAAALPSDDPLAATGSVDAAAHLAFPGEDQLTDTDIAPPGDSRLAAAAAGSDATHIARPGDDKHAMGSGCGASGCDERAGIHGCVFVLAALAAALTLVLLYRLTDDDSTGGGAAARPWRGRRERPPPWTVLTLSQLAILRI